MKCEICKVETKRKWRNFPICFECKSAAYEILPSIKAKKKNATLRDALRLLIKSRKGLEVKGYKLP